MKRNARRLILTFIIIVSGVTGYAQAVSTIKQNFDVACVLNSNFPAEWYRHNPDPATHPKGAWKCNPDNGRDSTPGLQCSGYYDNAFHLDTAYLIVPMLNLAIYAGKSIFLQFDAKTSNVANGSQLSVFTSTNEYFDVSDPTVDTGIAPPMGISDTSWTTHQVNLTSLISSNDFFVGFRYISNASTGSVWYIDNVSTVTARLGVPDIDRNALSLKIIGAASANNINISFEVNDGGKYELSLYDMMGRQVHKEQIFAKSGTSNHIIQNAGIQPGMYCVRLSSTATYGLAKVIVQ